MSLRWPAGTKLAQPARDYLRSFDAGTWRLLLYSGELVVLATLPTGRFEVAWERPLHEIALGPIGLAVSGALDRVIELGAVRDEAIVASREPAISQKATPAGASRFQCSRCGPR